MVPGMPNAYSLIPLVKMQIEEIESGEKMTVMYNPQSYRMNRSVRELDKKQGKSGVQQFSTFSVNEMLDVDLFLDTFSASAEVFGSSSMSDWAEKAKFTGNSLLPSGTKQLDVREYVNKIYSLCGNDEDEHTLPVLRLTWGSLDFTCILVRCSAEYVKFIETGVPVRAKLSCTFMRYDAKGSSTGGETETAVLNSPDTSKFHTVQQGETLNTLSRIAYDDMDHWREIALANGIVNPRILKTGETLRMPAITD